VAKIYRDFVGVFVLDRIDARFVDAIRGLGMKAIATDTIMSSPKRAQKLANVVLDALEVYP
jgi:hypothetical protein